MDTMEWRDSGKSKAIIRISSINWPSLESITYHLPVG